LETTQEYTPVWEASTSIVKMLDFCPTLEIWTPLRLFRESIPWNVHWIESSGRSPCVTKQEIWATSPGCFGPPKEKLSMRGGTAEHKVQQL
jgi:hypothetical protein